MKKILSIVLILNIALSLKGQDCNILDSLTSYRSMKFGQKFPDTLKDIFICDTLDDDRLRYTLWQPTTHLKGGNQYKGWFVVGETFEFIRFFYTPSKMLYAVVLQKEEESDKTVVITGNNFPAFYSSVVKELEYTFGTATYKNDRYESQGEKFVLSSWNCNNKTILFSLSYKSNHKEYLLAITDENIERSYKRERYRN